MTEHGPTPQPAETPRDARILLERRIESHAWSAAALADRAVDCTEPYVLRYAAQAQAHAAAAQALALLRPSSAVERR